MPPGASSFASALGLRLCAVLEDLCALPDRRAALTPGLAGPALRVLHEAQAFQLPRFVPESNPLMLGQIFAEALLTFDQLSALHRLNRKATPRPMQKSYRRASSLN